MGPASSHLEIQLEYQARGVECCLGCTITSDEVSGSPSWIHDSSKGRYELLLESDGPRYPPPPPGKITQLRCVRLLNVFRKKGALKRRLLARLKKPNSFGHSYFVKI